MTLISWMLLVTFALLFLCFYAGGWPFDGQPRQYGGMLFVSAFLTLIVASIAV